MSPGEIIALVGVGIVAFSLGMTWIRNGRSQAKRDGVMEERIKGINKKLEDPNTGLGAIKTSVEHVKLNCAEVTSSFKERIKNLEGD